MPKAYHEVRPSIVAVEYGLALMTWEPGPGGRVVNPPLRRNSLDTKALGSPRFSLSAARRSLFPPILSQSRLQYGHKWLVHANIHGDMSRFRANMGAKSIRADGAAIEACYGVACPRFTVR